MVKHTLSKLRQKLNDRLSVLQEFLEPDCNPITAARATDNFTLSDLRRLATRIQMECRISGSSTISEDNIKTALCCSRPITAITGKQKKNHNNINDVGGMEEQKKLLTEVLLWPTKYSELFGKCGITLGRGVLLHGQSGCGKTLLANSFASFTEFNVISIKGPELLSKYIGSSEENVRNVFERARSQTPCIVIFDELDSLAPKRGHDSTGVTDRVVNQLLTELDGAEGLSGVFVIGCTSRIDMIDEALLRPGRFDHLIECGLPSTNDRSTIIRVILKTVLHAKISHTAWAYRTEGWTGADLKALITNAQFNAHRNASKDMDIDSIHITEEDLDAVFEDSKPKERKTQIANFKAGQKVTLA
ncbi:unnamed protein product [Auanema sp. JU1783]|nr:unnamed protein product [Auanema sp. JU1783]